MPNDFAKWTTPHLAPVKELTMKKALLVLALTLPAAGCLMPSDQDRMAGTRFSINADRTFSYETDAVLRDSENFETAPVSTEYWLRDWLAANNMCPSGYQIVNRQRVAVGSSLGGRLYRATYTGRCV
jgi:GrpB-like predicted nucleotidyltransferase (UPF0157 family)